MKMERRLKRYRRSRKVRALLGLRPPISPAEELPNFHGVADRGLLGKITDKVSAIIDGAFKEMKAKKPVVNRAARRTKQVKFQRKTA